MTTTNRFTINGLIDTGRPVLENMEKIATASGAWVTFDNKNGLWSVIINKAETSSWTFDHSNIIGGVRLNNTGLFDLYNSVKVTYPRLDIRSNTDYIKLEIPDADRNANEPDNTLEISLDLTNQQAQAQLLGYRELKQARVDTIIEFVTDYTAMGIRAGDIITVTDAGTNLASELFRVITIQENDDTESGITISVTALKYDADVYDETGLVEFTRSTATGIVTTGSIGTPAAPTITKTERSARPKITAEFLVPSGLVEGMEVWYSTDTANVEADRVYTYVTTTSPLNGGVYAENDPVTLEYDNLDLANLYVKVRGVNSTTTGPFSNPSSLIEFNPEQTASAINDNTVARDSGTGALLTALGVTELLGKVDGLFGNVSNAGSLFDKVFSVFEDVTGVDLVNDVGSLNSGNLTVGDIGTPVTIPLSGNVEFVGNTLFSNNPYTDTVIYLVGNTSVTPNRVTYVAQPGGATMMWVMAGAYEDVFGPFTSESTTTGNAVAVSNSGTLYCSAVFNWSYDSSGTLDIYKSVLMTLNINGTAVATTGDSSTKQDAYENMTLDLFYDGSVSAGDTVSLTFTYTSDVATGMNIDYIIFQPYT